MGQVFSRHHDGELLVEIGTHDWRNYWILIWDEDARAIYVTSSGAQKLIGLLEKAIVDCDKANREGEV